jgi:predicted secreted protein
MPPNINDPEVNGTDILISIENPAASGTYLVIGSQRGATFAEQTAPIDFSSKNDRKGKFGPGRYTSTMSLEHLYVPSASGQTVLRNAMRDGTYVRAQRQEFGGPLESARCVVTNFSTSAPDQDAAVVSVELQVTGAWS